jgi:hypothetical protein
MPLLPILLLAAGRDLFLPIAGRISDPAHDVRTTVTLKNASSSEAHATIRYLPASGTPSEGRSFDVVVPPNAARSVDPFGDQGGLGALRITSDQELTASGRITSHAASAVFEARPASQSIGSGETATTGTLTFTHAKSETNRLYVVETSGDALQYSIILRASDGSVVSQSGRLIHAFRQHSIDLDDNFPTVTGRNVSVVLRGMNGGGRILAAAAVTKKPGGEIVPFEMVIASRRGRGLPLSETIAYAAIALFILGAALRSRRTA